MHRLFLNADKPSRTVIDPAADVTAWEREIDERAYRLYGLMPEEIKMVEENTMR